MKAAIKNVEILQPLQAVPRRRANGPKMRLPPIYVPTNAKFCKNNIKKLAYIYLLFEKNGVNYIRKINFLP